jgi:hypothetical protein
MLNPSFGNVRGWIVILLIGLMVHTSSNGRQARGTRVLCHFRGGDNERSRFTAKRRMSNILDSSSYRYSRLVSRLIPPGSEGLSLTLLVTESKLGAWNVQAVRLSKSIIKSLLYVHVCVDRYGCIIVLSKLMRPEVEWHSGSVSQRLSTQVPR